MKASPKSKPTDNPQNPTTPEHNLSASLEPSPGAHEIREDLFEDMTDQCEGMGFEILGMPGIPPEGK